MRSFIQTKLALALIAGAMLSALSIASASDTPDNCRWCDSDAWGSIGVERIDHALSICFTHANITVKSNSYAEVIGHSLTWDVGWETSCTALLIKRQAIIQARDDARNRYDHRIVDDALGGSPP